MKHKRLKREFAEGRLHSCAAAELFFWRAGTGRMVLRSETDRRTVAADACSGRVLRACGVDALVGIRFKGHAGYGWVLLPRGEPNAEAIIVARIVAWRFQAWAEEIAINDLLEKARAHEQRLSLVGELHDTVLQVLSGTFLQLQMLAPRISAVDSSIAHEVKRLLDLLALEHGVLRRSLQKFIADPGGLENEAVQLKHRLRELAQLMRRQWDLQVDWHIEPADARITKRIDEQLAQLLAELGVSARKHSGSSHLGVSVTVRPSDINLSVCNPRGDTARGNEIDLTRLRHHVERLGGALAVRSDSDRLQVDMTFPVH